MATATLAEQDFDSRTDFDIDPSIFDLHTQGVTEVAPESEETYLSARESWVLLTLNFEMIISQASRRTGSVAPEATFLLDASRKLRRRPDLAFISAERWPVDEPAPMEAAWNIIPDLAVEIVSPTDLIDDLMSKVEEYFAAGVRLVWVIHPKYRKLYVYRSPKLVTILDQDDTIDGGAVVAGFAMPLIRIFPPSRDANALAAE